MKRSLLNNNGRSYGMRHTLYNWKSHENANGRGYLPMESNSYQRFPLNNTAPQLCDNNFIPLNVSTPMTRSEKYNAANRYNSVGGYSSPRSGWYNNYRGNHHVTPRSNCSNRYPAYKYSPKQFDGQKRKGYRGAHRQVNISAYVDINSFLEDPWENLVKKLNDSKDISKSKEPKSLSNSKLANSDLIEISESKLSKNTNLDNFQCNEECKNKCSEDMNFETQNIALTQISKINNSVESEIDICSSQDLLNESTHSFNNKIYRTMQEKNIYPSTSIDQKDI